MGADGLRKGEQGDSLARGKLAPEGVVDDVIKKLAGGKGNPATNGSSRQTLSSSKSSCDDDGAAGKVKDGHVKRQSPVDVLGSQNDRKSYQLANTVGVFLKPIGDAWRRRLLVRIWVIRR